MSLWFQKSLLKEGMPALTCVSPEVDTGSACVGSDMSHAESAVASPQKLVKLFKATLMSLRPLHASAAYLAPMPDAPQIVWNIRLLLWSEGMASRSYR